MGDKFNAAGRLRELFEELKAHIEEVEAVTSKLRAERDKIMLEIQPLEDKAREIADRIKAHEAGDLENDVPPLWQVKNQLGDLAKALGGKSMSRPEPETATEPAAETAAGTEAATA